MAEMEANNQKHQVDTAQALAEILNAWESHPHDNKMGGFNFWFSANIEKFDKVLKASKATPVYTAQRRAVVNRIVKGIEEDILGRRGLKHELEACEAEVRVEIHQAWREIVSTAIDRLREGR